jgi:tape measure domain-containing protein
VNRKLAASTGSAAKTERAWTFLRKTSTELGLSLGTLTNQYGSLAAAAMGTSLQTKEIETIFTAISEKAAILGMNNQRVGLTFLAIEQMMSKGVISMEELRRQFGENVPGAMGIMARSLDVSTAELNKMVATGRLLSEDVLPLMADQMRKESKEAVKTLGGSMQASIAKLDTAFFDLKQTLVDGAINDAMKAIIGTMTSGVVVITSLGKALNWVWRGAREQTKEGLQSGLALGGMIKEVTKIVEDAAKAGMSDEERTEKQQKTKKNVYGETAKEIKASIESWQASVVGAFSNVLSEFSSFATDLAMGADVSFSKLLKSMSRNILDFVTTMLVVKPLLDWFARWIGATTTGGAGKIESPFMSKAFSSFGLKSYASGGVINEPVVGFGTETHSRYLLGEAGPEQVTPLNGSGGGGSGVNNININISAMDSESLIEFMSKNPGAITGPLVEQLNGGDRGLASSLRTAVL